MKARFFCCILKSIPGKCSLMSYRFAVERQDYTDYASGKVFYSLPGHPAFPIRLASEIFQRCLELRDVKERSTPVKLYDPCCGAAYHTAVLAYLHWDKIGEITVSDIDEQVLAVAKRNLALLTLDGLERRIGEIEAMQGLYGKESHRAARQSAEVMKNNLLKLISTHPLPVTCFQADALHENALEAHFVTKKADLVITDIPYGNRSQWIRSDPQQKHEPAWLLLENIREILVDKAIVAIASTKEQIISHERYRQVGKIKTGKRKVVLLEKR